MMSDIIHLQNLTSDPLQDRLAENAGLVEGILFASGEAVHEQTLAQALNIETDCLGEVLTRLAEDYTGRNRGLRLVQTGRFWQLTTKPELYEYIAKVVEVQESSGLSRAALETLAIIAYRQPITRIDIDGIRGVSSNSSVQRLMDKGHIKEAGRLEAPGRPILYKTTPDFLRSIGLASLQDLPSYESFSQEGTPEVAPPGPVEIQTTILEEES